MDAAGPPLDSWHTRQLPRPGEALPIAGGILLGHVELVLSVTLSHVDVPQ